MTFDAEVAAHARTSGIEPLLAELVKIRVSQINGCAYCLRYHTRDALALGETTDRLAVLSPWEETSYFSDRERAGLALAEKITEITDGHVPDSVYTHAASVLTETEISAISWLAIAINTFSRIAIASRYPVSP